MDGLEDALRLQPIDPDSGGEIEYAGRGSLERTDNQDWTIEDIRPEQGTAWVVQRSVGTFPHDVVIRAYEGRNGLTTVRAWSRSRVSPFDYRRNRRILMDLSLMLQEYWTGRGADVRPIGDLERD